MKTFNAKMQYQFTSTDLELILALVRGTTLSGAAERLGVDASTVFRGLQRIERGLGEVLFDRSRMGYSPSERATDLAQHAERIEAMVEQARGSLQAPSEQVAGSVRITTTDTVLHGLVSPALAMLRTQHPHLSFDLHTGNDLANLTRRDADIAVRATKRAPPHLVGKCIGPIRVAVYAQKKSSTKRFDMAQAAEWDWVAPDDGLPEHPSVVWRQRHFPKLIPRFRTSSVQSVAEMVAQGMGIGILPLFLAEPRSDLRRLTEPLDDCATDLWVLTHPESRHLKRISTVYLSLAQAIRLP
jgi:DNA-binding transcriptional LysR family regulator